MDVVSLAELSDADLLARVQVLAHNERSATAALVTHLAEIENRKLYLAQACASLFVYCTRVLHLSEHAAYNRIEAARAGRRFPAVLVSLERGHVHLTAIRLLAPLLTDENHRDVLAQATHKSKREVEELLARLRPQPDVPAQVRKLPGSKPSRPALAPALGTKSTDEEAVKHPAAPEALCRATATPAVAAVPPAAAAPAVVVPLAPERYKVQFTASAATREKLRRAQELLRHRIPPGDVAEVIDLALDLLVRDLEKKKFAATDRPRESARGAPGAQGVQGVRLPSRYIPAEVKRAVWDRDRGRCAFVSEKGDHCGERGGLEFDHIRPHADGGGSTVDNVRLLCRGHNQYEAQLFYGLWQADRAREPAPRSNGSPR